MTTLRDLAEGARMMPWDKYPLDVPFAARQAFSDAVTPEIFLEMLGALQSLTDAAGQWVSSSGQLEEAYLRAHVVIAKVTP